MLLLIAIIGLVGTIAASGAVTEWLRRRDVRESIKSDVEVWEKLPECDAKDLLLGRIQSRIEEVATRRDGPTELRAALIATAVVIVGNAIYWSLIVFNGGYHWARDQRGVLYLHLSDGAKIPFIIVVVLFIAPIAIGPVLMYSYRLIRRYLSRLIKK